MVKCICESLWDCNSLLNNFIPLWDPADGWKSKPMFLFVETKFKIIMTCNKISTNICGEYLMLSQLSSYH